MTKPTRFTAIGRALYGATPPGGALPCARRTPLTDDEIARIVELIATARLDRRTLDLPERLRTRDWPSVMRVMLALDHRLGWTGAGWKIGAASAEIRRAENVPGPAPGRIYRHTVRESPATLPSSMFINYRNAECEFAFRTGADLPPRAAGYTEAEVRAAIVTMHPALEIGDSVFADWYGTSAFFGTSLDNGGGAALVLGPAVDDWAALDLPATKISVCLDGVHLKDGYGRAAMGHPVTSLTWLVNWLSDEGIGLPAGAVVSTGTCTGHTFAAPGDRVTAAFAGVGTVTADFDT
jgi:2-keto-4-pentenoate hydratase